MVAARNLENAFAAQQLALPTTKMFSGVSPYRGLGRYDRRFAMRYARKILAAANEFEVLDAEMRAASRNDNAALRDFRNDAGLPIAFARSLEYIIRQPYEALYPELRAPEFIPLMTEVPPEALSFTYRMFDRTGVAKIINENGSDAPKVDLKAEEWQQPLVTIGCSYDYTILDTMRAARLNVPLESFKAIAARKACEYLVEQIAAVGAPDYGIVGITNAPGVSGTTQVSTGGSWLAQIGGIGAANTSNNTVPALVVAQAIIADFNAMVNNIIVTSNGVHVPNTGLLPVAVYSALRTTPRSPGFTDDSLLEYVEKMTGLELECWPQLNAAGAISTTYAGVTSKGRVMVYQKDPDVLNLVQAQPFTQLPPQPTAMAWEVTCYMRHGGVQVRRPKAVTYMDGVS